MGATHPTIMPESPTKRSRPSEPIPDTSPLRRWLVKDGNTYVPVGVTTEKLEPGVYEFKDTQEGIVLVKTPIKEDSLFLLPSNKTDEVVADVEKFWANESLYREYNISYKRGIILYGPPGSGKSGAIQLIIREIIKRKGIVLRLTEPYMLAQGYRKFREIEPNTPSLIIMEDIDDTIQRHSESTLLNILDGMDNMEGTVFLATTNYPHLLAERILNRPGRFDRRFLIGMPGTETRQAYLTKLTEKYDKHINIYQWVSDTENLSIAHLKELFISVILFGYDYNDTLKTLRSMKELVHDDSNLPEGMHE